MRHRLTVISVAMLAAFATVAAVGPDLAAGQDYASIARNIIPSGQYGALPPPPQAAQQAEMYNALTPLFNHVTAPDLLSDFKPEQLGVMGAPAPVTTETVPQPGVTIYRDAYDVPYVYGVTRDDVTWGAGWVLAEDRGVLVQEARYLCRIGAIDAPGLSAIDLIGKLASFTPSGQTESEVSRQTQALLAHGPRGERCCTTSTSSHRA